MRRINISILLSLLLLLPLSLNGQSKPLEIDDILKSHYKVIGLEKKSKIHSLVSIGSLNQLGANLQVSIIQKRPSYYRMDVHLSEGRISQGFDGENGWMLNPFVSGDTVQITGPELNQLKESADFDGVLVNHTLLGYDISYEAAGMYLEHPVYILKLTNKGGNNLRFFLDSKSFLILKTEASYLINGMPLNAVSEFSDYKKVGGVLFPYKIINRNGQLMTEMRIDTIRINERLEDVLFK